MGRYLIISGCAAVAFHSAGITSAEVYESLMALLAANRTELVGGGLLGILALGCASLLFSGIGFFNILYVMAKAVFELIQLLFCAICLAALIFWFDLGVDFWLEGGEILTFMLYVWLYGAAFCLRVFDFNYPVRDTLIAYSALPMICLVLIRSSSLVL